MNAHLPQTQQARAEVATIMAQPERMLSAQTNTLICGLVQDALWASYLMTRRGVYEKRVTIEQFSDLVMYIDPFDMNSFARRVHKHFPKEKYFIYKKNISDPTTGQWYINKTIFKEKGFPAFLVWSAAFPEQFYFELPSDDIHIENGILIKGTMAKKHIGPGGIIPDKMIKYYDSGTWVTANWMGNIENITNIWATYNGFSISICDLLAENTEEISATLAEIDLKYDTIVTDKSKNAEEKEMEVTATLNSAIAVGAKLVKKGMYGGENNALSICINSKAKGSTMNTAQISGALGQQNLMGGRIPKTLNGGKRCLPYFEEYDDTPAARGFVSGNLIDGLSLPEAFFHSLGGREGLVDTACKTRETGYLQRSLIKVNEDIKVSNNQGIVMAYGNVVQMNYGKDNFDGSRLSKVKFPDGETRLFFCDPLYISKQLKSISKNTKTCLLNQEEIDKLVSIIKFPATKAKLLHNEAIVHNLKTLFIKLLQKVELPEGKFNMFYNRCKQMFHRAIIPAGEAVGIVAASAKGEMSTQQTLNTFHSSGTVHKTTTQGVPRLKEIKDTTKKPKSRSIDIYFKSELWPSENMTTEEVYKFFESYSNKIKEVTIGELLICSEIQTFEKVKIVGLDEYYPITDPLGVTKLNMVKLAWWETEYLANTGLEDNEIFNEKLHCGYRVCLNFDKQKVYDLNISMFNIADFIEDKLKHIINLIVVPSPTVIGQITMYLGLQEDILKVCSSLGITSKNKYSIITEVTAPYLCLRDIILPKLKSICVGENTEVKKFFVERGEGDKLSDKFYLSTEGGNFETILSLDFVDSSRTITDDFWQIYNAFDIEAAKKCLINEFNKALTGDGGYIDPRLIELTVSGLCRRGTIDSMRRDSVPMDITGFVQKMAFEKPVQYGIQAALLGAFDSCDSVSGSITIGKNPLVGTDFVTIVDQENNTLEY